MKSDNTKHTTVVRDRLFHHETSDGLMEGVLCFVQLFSRLIPSHMIESHTVDRSPLHKPAPSLYRNTHGSGGRGAHILSAGLPGSIPLPLLRTPLVLRPLKLDDRVGHLDDIRGYVQMSQSISQSSSDSGKHALHTTPALASQR